MRTKNITAEGQDGALSPRDSVAELFHENSKLNAHGRRRLGERVARIVASPWARRLPDSLKSHPAAPQWPLPRARLHGDASIDLQAVIVNRRSRRAFDEGRPVSLQQLANLLQLSYGITGKMDVAGGATQFLRAVPSAGALYPLEIYLMVNRVEGLPAGLYHYRVAHHALEELARPDPAPLRERMARDWGLEPAAAVTVLVSGVFARSCVKYLDRGYRFVLFEAGGLAQQLTLLGECQGIGSCIMGGWPDDEVNQIFGLDGTDESMLLALCMGIRKGKTP
jgi:SagB-type dehydrogenase family enzyme